MDLPKYVKDLQGLLDLMQKGDLAEIEIEEDGRKIRLRRLEFPVAAPAVYAPAPAGVVMPPTPRDAGAGAAEPAHEAEVDLHVVRSPLVGTFYRASSPEAEPFVKEGDRVESDTVLGIIEAMKVMNEIPAGVSGVVREILAQNGEPVEFGEPLFRIETL